jgi:DMSO/TMAO reductase YedYZ molybdopterin-dependent catalytic subunit
VKLSVAELKAMGNEETILAWEMNYDPLPLQYGAPLRPRVENQLGYKMVKWIRSIEFVESYNSWKGFRRKKRG